MTYEFLLMILFSVCPCFRTFELPSFRGPFVPGLFLTGPPRRLLRTHFRLSEIRG